MHKTYDNICLKLSKFQKQTKVMYQSHRGESARKADMHKMRTLLPVPGFISSLKTNNAAKIFLFVIL